MRNRPTSDRTGESHLARTASESVVGTPGTSDFLAQLSAQDHADLLAIARSEKVGRQQMVFRAGEPSTRVYIIKTGLIKIFEVSDGGREAILWFCLVGEIFGLSEAVAGGIRGVNAMACEASEVLSIHGDEFREFLAHRPQAALLCMQALSARLRGLGHVLVNFVSDDVHTRIGKLLLRLSARYGQRVGTEVVLRIPLTHQTISDMVGAARPTVSSVLSDLRRRGVLSIGSRRVRIESEELLQEWAEGSPGP